MTEDRDALAPCPLCGSRAVFYTPFAVGDAYGYVECDEEEGGCGCRGPILPTETEAVAAWNARILPPTTSAGDGELVEHLQERLLNEQMLAFKWMDAHDKLKAGKPYSFPAPADLPDALARVKELEEALTKIDRIGRTNRGPGVRIAQMQEVAQAALNPSPTEASDER